MDAFTESDISDGGRHVVLGPAYFAARRVAEQLMQGVESEPLIKVLKKCADDLTNGIYTYIEDGMRSDLESNLQGHIRDMVERTVRALLTGEEWALNQYPLAKYHDGEQIRAAVAKHGGDPLLMMRIADLETEVGRLRESLKYAHGYS